VQQRAGERERFGKIRRERERDSERDSEREAGAWAVVPSCFAHVVAVTCESTGTAERSNTSSTNVCILLDDSPPTHTVHRTAPVLGASP